MKLFLAVLFLSACCGQPPTAGAVVEGGDCLKLHQLACVDGKSYACAQWYYMNGGGITFSLKPGSSVWIQQGSCP